MESKVRTNYAHSTWFKSSPCIKLIPGGLTVGKQFIIQGSVPLNEDSFGVNLACGASTNPRADTALHFNPRFSENCVVRNTLQNGSWGPEERYGTFPFKNYTFGMIILVEQNQYQITVNGKHVTGFEHRIPFHSVTHLTIEGGLKIKEVIIKAPAAQVMSYQGAGGYPPQPVYNKPTPYVEHIPGGLTVGKQFVIQGVVQLNENENSFRVNLACGPCTNPRADTAFHFNPRFEENCVVRNTLQNASWGKEERYGTFPFNRNYPFEIIILVEHNQYAITVNEQHFTEFQHRIPFHRVTHLTIEGGVKILEVYVH